MRSVFPLAFRAAGQDGFVPSEVSPPVLATRGGGAAMPTIVTEEGDVRRATPPECLALQGFPPGHLDGVLVDGEPLSDTAKYRLIGNSWPVPTVRWAFRRLDAQLRGA